MSQTTDLMTAAQTLLGVTQTPALRISVHDDVATAYPPAITLTRASGVTSNLPPRLTVSVPTQTARERQAFNYTIPANTFTDPEGGRVFYTTQFSAGASTWLRFDATTRVLSGTPPANTPDVTVTLWARDAQGSMASTRFLIRTTTATTTRANVPAANASILADNLTSAPLRTGGTAASLSSASQAASLSRMSALVSSSP